jgi:hypothetical protein
VAVKQLPAKLDLEFVAGNPFDLTITCTGATVTSPVVAMKTAAGDAYTTNPGTPAASALASVITVGWGADDSAALNAATRPKTYLWSVQGTVDGEGPFELCAGPLTVRPVGSAGTSTSAAATLAVTVGGAAVTLEVSLGGSGGGASAIAVQEGDSTVVTTVSTLDFGAGFDVTESPAGEGNIALDLTEYSGGALPVAVGGTGATSAGAALTALGAAAASDLSTVSTGLSDHLSDTDDAHDASAISYAGGTGMSATNVETAIDELATEKADASVLLTNGKGYVNHGGVAGTARPSEFASIEWHGTVEPTNAIDGDTWIDTTT